jgi:hypothetical protein
VEQSRRAARDRNRPDLTDGSTFRLRYFSAQLKKSANLLQFQRKPSASEVGKTGRNPVKSCVIFGQQSAEKQRNGLWERAFLIACARAIGNSARATEGGIPRSRYLFVAVGSFGVPKSRVGSGEHGDVPKVPCRTRRIRPSQEQQCFGGSR